MKLNRLNANNRKLREPADESQKASESSFLELCVFAVFFVVVFSVIARTARADEQSAAPPVTVEHVADPSASGEPLHPVGEAATLPTGAMPTANISATLPQLKPQTTFGWATKLTAETSQNLAADDSRKYGGWYQIATSYTDQKTSLAYALKAGWFQEYTKVKDSGRGGDLDNPVLSVSKVWAEGEAFRSRIIDFVTLGLSATIGASYESTVHRSFIGGFGPSVAVSKLLFGKLHLGQMLGYARGFYTYDMRGDGTVNSPDVFSSKTDVSVDVLEKLALSLSTKVSYGIDFQKVGKSTELSSISLDYTPSTAVGLSLGVQTERGTISDDGTSNRIAFYDGSVAQGFLDMSLSF